MNDLAHDREPCFVCERRERERGQILCRVCLEWADVRAAPIGSPRQRAYHVLSVMQAAGWIEAYIATQFPNGRWGFRLTLSDGSEFLMLPREVHAFAEGIKVASRARDTPIKPAG